MDQIAAVLSLGALLISAVALLLAVSAVLRANRFEARFPGFGESGIKEGATVEIAPLSKFLVPAELERVLHGPSILIFTSGGCPACEDLYKRLHASTPFEEEIYVIGAREDKADEVPKWVHRIFDPESQLQHSFGVNGTPQAFVIRSGRVVSKMLGPEIERLRGQRARAAVVN
jgi:hypothetical protein